MPWGTRVECAFASQPMAASPTWTDITSYVEPPVGITVGRGDEFSEVQPSTLSVRLRNFDGRFTMGNTAGAYWPNVKPGRRIRVTSGYTAKNWVTNPTFDVDIVGWVAGGSVPPTLARTTVTPHSGAGALLITWGTGGTFPQAATTLGPLKIGQTYTCSAWVNVPATNPALKLAIASGPVGLPSTITGSYQQISVTFTATSTTHSLQVWPDTAPTSGQTGRVDDVQVEEGAAVTTFDGAGMVAYPRFDGHVNGWPTSWDAPGGVVAMCAVSATDRLKRFGQVGELRSMLEEEILRDEASTATTGLAYYPLSEPAGAVTAANISRTIVRPVGTTSLGSGTIRFGEGTGPGTDGLPAPIFDPSTASLGQFLDVNPLNVGVGFFGLTLECFFRPNASVTSRILANLTDGSGNTVYLFIDSSGHLQSNGFNAGVSTFTLTSSAVVNDNTTHHGAVTLSISGSTVTVVLYLDGASAGTTTYSSTALMMGTRLTIGGRQDGFLFAGTISHVAAHSTALASGRIADHWNAGDNGLAGERTDQRLGRMATWIGIPAGDRALDVGDGTVGAQSTSGKQALDAMREVEATEAGVLFISGDNKLTFHKRSRRYNVSPAFTLPAGEISDNAEFPGDDFGVTNDMTVTRAGASPARSVNQSSIDEFGLYRDSADVATNTDDATQAIADWRVNTYGTPRVRIPNVTVEVAKLEANNPSLVPAVLAATISTKLRLGTLPANAPASSVDVFIEGWTEQIDAPVSWQIAWNTSPGDVSDVWQLGVSGYSELGVTTRLGQ